MPELNLIHFANPRSTPETPEPNISIARQKILDKPEAAPLSTWNAPFKAGVALGRRTMEHIKNSLALARALAQGRKSSTPVAMGTKITKIKIERRKDLLLDGMTQEDAEGTFNAEWIDYHPKNRHKKPAERIIIYTHGGVYLMASRRTHRLITWRLAKYAHARVLAIDYRLSPEATFPLALHDAISTYLYLIDPPAGSNAHKYLPEQISFVGDSAGGGLATAAMLWLRDHGKIPLPGAVGCMSPYYDLTHSFPSWYVNAPYDILPEGAYDPKYHTKERPNLYCKDTSQLLHPHASPFMSVESADKPIPPMLIQLGCAERVRDDGIVFAENSFPNSPIRLEIYQHQFHVFQLFAPISKIAEYALMRMGHFIHEQTGNTNWKRPQVKHQAIFIENIEGFPIHDVPDAIGIVDDGVRLLVQRGEWTRDMPDTSLFVVRNLGNVVRPERSSTENETSSEMLAREVEEINQDIDNVQNEMFKDRPNFLTNSSASQSELKQSFDRLILEDETYMTGSSSEGEN